MPTLRCLKRRDMHRINASAALMPASSQSTNDEALTDDNAHVQELKRIFLSCCVDELGCLNSSGLTKLCDKLKLAAFAPEIIRRVLLSETTVNFQNFKERFVALLPEIIDVSSGAIDELATLSVQNVRKLRLGDSASRLTRYETRLLCENTGELSALTVGDVSALFDRADVDRNGRVSVHQFLQQYRLQKRLSAEVHFIADSFVPSINLFDALDSANTGTIDSHDLLEYWSKAGLRIDEGISVLKQCGQPISGSVNAVFLSSYLERELSDAAAEAPVAVKTAIIALHSCIDHLRCAVKDAESRAEHLHKQLQTANQRRTLLIEELEANQLSIEQSFETRLRETEERFKLRLCQFEEKARQEKRELQTEIERCEEELSQARQSESSSRNKVTLLERQCNRLNTEAQEFSETIAQLEQLNRQLRSELSKTMQPRPQDDNVNVLMWKQKTELLVAHNKRLREKVQELTVSQKKARATRDINALYCRWSPAFRTQVATFRKRRLARGDTLSEMDSEPESIFARVRRRKLKSRRDRKQKHERTLSRLSTHPDEESTSSESKPSTSKVLSLAHEASIKKLEERVFKLQEDHRRELTAMKASTSKTLADALNEQEKQLAAQWEKERRQLEARLANEKSQMEKLFAEEKMKLMSRLQDDFEAELQRIMSTNQNEGPAAIEQYKRQIKGQRNGYERKLAELRDKFRNQSMSSMSARCERCELVDVRLRELYYSCTGDKTKAESGIEDIGSSAGSLSDVPFFRGVSKYAILKDKTALKREISRLKSRLEAAKEKVAELRVLFSMQNGSLSARYKCITTPEASPGDWRRASPKWSEVNGSTVERLESEKLILESRLAEAQLLIKNLVEQYRKQLDETARLGAILQDMYAQNTSTDSSNGSISRSAPPSARQS